MLKLYVFEFTHAFTYIFCISLFLVILLLALPLLWLPCTHGTHVSYLYNDFLQKLLLHDMMNKVSRRLQE